MKRAFLSLLAAALVLLPAQAQLRLVRDGRMTGRIILAHPGAPGAEREALQLMLSVPVTDAPMSSTEWAMVIRKGDIVLRDLDRDEAAEELPEDAFRLTVDSRNVTIAGHGKALLYGAAEFLKRLGADYWGDGEYYSPYLRELTLAPLDTVIVPTFRYRQSQNYMLASDPLYKVWYHLEQPSEIFAGNLWVHTCNTLLPAARYGKDHPEYYAWYNSRRNPGSASQWCMSNPEVLEIVCARLDSLFKAHPHHKMVSISQNDGSDTYCRCPECSRIMEEEGGPSGPILRFINAVAERFPDKEISTLAYLFSVQPPRKTVPRENVSIMLCDIDCRRQTSLPETPSGREFMKALESWAPICRDLFVWDYGINFDNYLSPFPNLSTIKDNMLIFKDHNVKMHFSQIAGVRGGDLAELRSYIVNNLMWDATASLDSLERRFLTHYYGQAAWPLYKYIKLMEGAAIGTDVDLFIYDSPVSYKGNILRPELMRRYNALFDEAEAAVAGDPVRLARVRRTRLPLQYSALEIARTDPDRDREETRTALDLFEARTREFGVEMLNERHNTPAEYCALYRTRYLGSQEGNLAAGRPVRFLVEPGAKYRPIAAQGLTDGIYGGATFVENWIGWEGCDAAFVLDLGAERAIREISVDFLRQLGAWILMPEQVRFSLSADGESFTEVASVDLPEDRGNKVEFIPVQASCHEQARYVRVDIVGTKTCPEWHYGVGNPCWFFIDEIVVR